MADKDTSISIRDCRWPWNRLYLHANGDIKPCCYATMPLGNASDGDTLSSVWAGKQMADLRRAIENNKLHPVCAGAGCAFVKSATPSGPKLEALAVYAPPPPVDVDEDTVSLARMGRAGSMHVLGAALLAHGDDQADQNPRQARRYHLSGLRWLWRAHRQNYPLSSYLLACRIAFWPTEQVSNSRILGRLQRPSRKHVALRLAQKAADDGYAPAITLLGNMREYFHLPDADLDRAIETYERAGSAGDALGFYYAGRLLEKSGKGDGTRFRKLAKQRGLDVDKLDQQVQ